MAGTPIEQAAASIARIPRAIETLRAGREPRFIVRHRITDALDVTSACMAQMNAEQSRITRHRLADAADIIEGIATGSGDTRLIEFTAQHSARIRAIARGGS